MGIIQTITRPFRRRAARHALRSWEAAQTDRLNKTHWANAQGEPINRELSGDLDTLRARAAHEVKSNPMLEGVIYTHVTDVVGPEGPKLRVESSNARYNQALEDVWSDWWARPDFNGVMSGPDLLKSWMRSVWINGEFLFQLVTADGARNDALSLRILDIHPRRLQTPLTRIADPAITMGIERTAQGRPVAYFIAAADDTELSASLTFDSIEVPASDITHGFRSVETGQARGVPICAPMLQVAADLKDYDAQTLDAVRMAADHSIVLWTNHPDSQFLPVNESTDIERRVISTAPPGWEPKQIKPEQPGTVYQEYKKERQIEYGRPVNMPLMSVRLDASDHNYSSARMDRQGYQRGNQDWQTWLSTSTLIPLVAEVEREARLAGLLPLRRPNDLDLTWTWPMPLHADPVKEAQAEQIKREMKAVSLASIYAHQGKDWETELEQIAREKAKLEELGLDDQPKMPEIAEDDDDETEAERAWRLAR